MVACVGPSCFVALRARENGFCGKGWEKKLAIFKIFSAKDCWKTLPKTVCKEACILQMITCFSPPHITSRKWTLWDRPEAPHQVCPLSVTSASTEGCYKWMDQTWLGPLLTHQLYFTGQLLAREPPED